VRAMRKFIRLLVEHTNDIIQPPPQCGFFRVPSVFIPSHPATRYLLPCTAHSFTHFRRAVCFSDPRFAIMIPRCIQKSHFPLRRIDVHTRCLRFSTTSPTPTPSGPSRFSRYGRNAVKYTAFTCFSAVLGLSVVVGGVFIHDVFTYSDKHVDRVPVSPLALHPERGGPKNLPVASVLVGDEDDGTQVPVMGKPKLVIVGGGWGVRYIPFICTVF